MAVPRENTNAEATYWYVDTREYDGGLPAVIVVCVQILLCWYVPRMQRHFSYALLLHTIDVVILAGGKFHENDDKTFHVGVIFYDPTLISLIKSNWFYFRLREKMQKLPPHEIFTLTVYEKFCHEPA